MVLLNFWVSFILFFTSVGKAEKSNSFHFYDRTKTNASGFKKCSDFFDLKNMSPIRSQGSLAVCYAMSSAVIAQFHFCKMNSDACSSGVPKGLENSISPLSMMAWTRTNEGINPGNASSYTNLVTKNTSMIQNTLAWYY